MKQRGTDPGRAREAADLIWHLLDLVDDGQFPADGPVGVALVRRLEGALIALRVGVHSGKGAAMGKGVSASRTRSVATELASTPKMSYSHPSRGMVSSSRPRANCSLGSARFSVRSDIGGLHVLPGLLVGGAG